MILLVPVAPGMGSLCGSIDLLLQDRLTADDCPVDVASSCSGGPGRSVLQANTQAIEWETCDFYEKIVERVNTFPLHATGEGFARGKWWRRRLQSRSSSSSAGGITGLEARTCDTMTTSSMRLRGGAVTLRKRKAVESVSMDTTTAHLTSRDPGQDVKLRRGAAAKQRPSSKRGAPKKNAVGGNEGGNAEDDSSGAEKGRKEIEWANMHAFPAAPPQVIDREYTLEEDLALISQVEDKLRR